MKARLVLPAALTISLILLAGCQTFSGQGSSAPAPVAAPLMTVFADKGMVYTNLQKDRLSITIHEEIKDFINLSVWIRNDSTSMVHFATSNMALTVKTPEGKEYTYIPLSAEEYNKKVLSCWTSNPKYSAFQEAVRKAYLYDAYIEPGTTNKGLVYFDAPKGVGYELVLWISGKSYVLDLPGSADRG